MKDNLLKILVIISLIVIVPRFFVGYNTRVVRAHVDTSKLSYGVPNLVQDKSYMDLVRVAQCGVICDCCEPNGQTLPEVLKKENCAVNRVFLTEARGAELDTWRKQFAGVYQLSGSNFDELKEACADVNLLIFDVQGFGFRADRATRLLRSVMEVASGLEAKLVVLDVPNPLGGKVEGPGEVPLRPGVTLGELARYWNDKVFHGRVSLVVVPVIGWKRDLVLNDLQRDGRKFGSHAPILSFFTPFCHVKPFSTFVSDGGDEAPAPALLMSETNRLSGWELSYLKDMLAANGVTSTAYDAHAAELAVSGLKITTVVDQDDTDSFSTFMKTMRFFSNRKTFMVEYEKDFDDVMGNTVVRETLLGKKSFEQLRLELEKTQSVFVHDIGQYLLYEPAPYPRISGAVAAHTES